MFARFPFIAIFALFPVAVIAQDKVIGEAIETFKGTADEARKANPLLATVTGDGVVKAVKNLVSGRSAGTRPATVEMPKEQQEELARRQKARERAEQLAKAGPRQVAASAPVSTLPAITPVALLAMQQPPRKPELRLVEEAAVAKVHAGVPRAEVLAALGEPNADSVVHGLSDGVHEVMTYHLSVQRTVAVRLTAGIVTVVVRN